MRNKAEIWPYADGIWLDVDDHNEAFNAAGAYLVMLDACDQKSARAIRKDYYFFVPLWMIFPGLRHIPDGAVFTGRGQQVSFNINTTNYSECIYDVAAVNAYTYTLSGLGLLYRYARIHPLMDRILMREFIFHPVVTDSQRIPVAKTTNNFNLSISAGERMKRLIFGFCPNQVPADAILDTSARAYGANRLNQLLTYFPKFRIDQIQLDIGGQRMTITADQAAVLQLIPPTQTVNMLVGYEGKLYDGFRADLHQVYAVDLSRFPVDVIGATNKAHTSVLGSVVVKVGAEGTLLSLTDAALDANMLARFDMYVYLEKTLPIHLTRG